MDATKAFLLEHADGIKRAEELIKLMNHHRRPTMRNRVENNINQPYIQYTGKNWCHLPTKLKSKLIEDMDINIRLSLRATAHAEREIIDSQKVHFSKIVFDNRERDLNDPRYYLSKRYGEVTAEYAYPPITLPGQKSSKDATSSSSTEPTSAFFKRKELKIYDKKMYFSAVYFLAYVLKVGKIDTFEIEETYSPDRFEKCLKILAESAPFHIKNFNVILLKKPLVMFFMKHLAEGLETIHLNAEDSPNFPFDKFLTFPVFVNAKLININNLDCTKAVSKLAEQWIINDTPIGHRIQTSVSNGLKVMDEFIVKFVDRIVIKNADIVRIRTDNQSKHILLQYVEDRNGNKFIGCFIISSDLQEPVYDGYHSWTSQLGNCRYSSFDESCWDENAEEEEEALVRGFEPVVVSLRHQHY